MYYLYGLKYYYILLKFSGIGFVRSIIKFYSSLIGSIKELNSGRIFNLSDNMTKI